MNELDTYYDFSQVVESNVDAATHRLSNFPLKLHSVLSALEQSGRTDIAAWLPHGRSFIVHKPEEFVEQVLLSWFKQSKFASFLRQLNIYGFTRIVYGPDSGGYYHELFLRGKAFLTDGIARFDIKGKGPRKAACVQPPNFYVMPIVSEGVIVTENAHSDNHSTPSPPSVTESVAISGDTPSLQIVAHHDGPRLTNVTANTHPTHQVTTAPTSVTERLAPSVNALSLRNRVHNDGARRVPVVNENPTGILHSQRNMYGNNRHIGLPTAMPLRAGIGPATLFPGHHWSSGHASHGTVNQSGNTISHAMMNPFLELAHFRAQRLLGVPQVLDLAQRQAIFYHAVLTAPSRLTPGHSAALFPAPSLADRVLAPSQSERDELVQILRGRL